MIYMLTAQEKEEINPKINPKIRERSIDCYPPYGL